MANKKKRNALEEQERQKENLIKKYFNEAKKKKVPTAEESLKQRSTLQVQPRDATIYSRLFVACQGQKAKFFDQRPVVPAYSNQDNTFLNALVRISNHSESWIRKPEDWVCKTYNADRQFASLVRHLFAKYDVPGFFDTVWFTNGSINAVLSGNWDNWFVRVGQGINVRKIKEVPIKLSKKMAHEMMKAPSDYTIQQALRWGQVQGLGGDERLVKALSGTFLGEQFGHEEFWSTVIHWFVNQPMFDVVHVNPIIDYIQNQKFVPVGRVIENDEVVDRGVPQPNFEMKGRTLNVLLRKVREWHGDLNKTVQIKEHIKWAPCTVKSSEIIEGRKKPLIWKINEILDNIGLAREGKAMKHCVASYVGSCKSRRSAIFSMTCNDTRMLTIEINLQTMSLNQVRGSLNRSATPVEMRILKSWAAKEGMGFSRWVKDNG